MNGVVEVIASVAMLSAVGFVALAAFGLIRFDDTFSRTHAATKAITLGVILVGLGAALLLDSVGDVAKLVLAVGLQIVSAPVASHMVCRAAYRAGVPMTERVAVDQLDRHGSTRDTVAEAHPDQPTS